MKVNTLLIKKGKNDPLGFIVIRITFDDKSMKTITTGLKIHAKDWDKKNKKVKSFNPDANRINRVIRNKIQEVYNAEDFCYKNDIPFNKYFFDKGKQEYTLNNFIKEFLLKDKILKTSTKELHFALLNILNHFNPAIHYKDIDKEFAESYTAFLLKKGNKISYIKMVFNNLKKYFNLLLDEGKLKPEQYRGIKKYINTLKADNPNKDFLTIEEIRKLEKIEYSNNFTKEKFLLSFYLGIRVSDLYDLRWEHIHLENGVIRKKTIKTGDIVVIPLKLLFGEKSIKLLESMKGQHPIFIFPRDKNERKWYLNYLRSLEKFIKLSGINKHVTPHTARHSCATYLVERYNIKVAQTVLGHSDIKTTEKYYHLSEGSIVNMIKSANKGFLKVI